MTLQERLKKIDLSVACTDNITDSDAYLMVHLSVIAQALIEINQTLKELAKNQTVRGK